MDLNKIRELLNIIFDDERVVTEIYNRKKRKESFRSSELDLRFPIFILQIFIVQKLKKKNVKKVISMNQK